MQKVRHLFWDFDGTLYNSYPKILASFRRALEELCPAHGMTDADIMKLMKVSVGHAIKGCAEQLGLDREALHARYTLYHHKETHFPPYDGLADCLEQLYLQGFRHYLYTHRDLTSVAALKNDGLWQWFSGGITKEDGFPLKPAPDALLSLLEKHQLSPEACAMVGDRDIDLDAGKNAGMKTILFDPDRYYQEYPAHLKVYSMTELRDALL